MLRCYLLVSTCLLVAGCCCPLNAWSNRSSEPSSWTPSTPSPPTVQINPPTAPFGSNPGPMPEMPAPPGSPSAPTAPTAPPPPGVPSVGGREPPTSFGVASCDEYARAACACPNAAIRDRLCDGAHSAFRGWTNAARFGAREILSSTCTRLIDTIRQSCPAAAAESAPSIGLPICDAYAQRACSCSNTLARPTMCSAARSSLQSFQGAIDSGGMTRDRVNTTCQSLLDSATSACP